MPVPFPSFSEWATILPESSKRYAVTEAQTGDGHFSCSGVIRPGGPETPFSQKLSFETGAQLSMQPRTTPRQALLPDKHYSPTAPARQILILCQAPCRVPPFRLSGHESALTTGLYDRRGEEIWLDEIERIGILITVT